MRTWRTPAVVLSVGLLVGLAASPPSGAAARAPRASVIDAAPANVEYDPGGYGTYRAAALKSTTIGAVDVNLNWYEVEPESGTFDFAPADKEVAAWASRGKEVTLELRFQHEENLPAETCRSDGWLPPWEVMRIPTTCEELGTARSLLVPDYFDETFLEDWRAYVLAVADHFAASPYSADIAYVRVALGLGAESFPLEPCYHPDAQGCSLAAYDAEIHQLRAWGYTASSWLAWQELLLADYRHAFGFTTVIYPINQMLYPASSPLNWNPATGDPIEMDVAYWAAAHGVGIGQEGLNGTYRGAYASFNDIFTYVHRHFPTTYLEFQTVAALGNKTTPTCNLGCLVQADVRAAEHYHACSIEWYAADVANPALQPYFAQWQRYVLDH
jgi:hypothetical protein